MKLILFACLISLITLQIHLTSAEVLCTKSGHMCQYSGSETVRGGNHKFVLTDGDDISFKGSKIKHLLDETNNGYKRSAVLKRANFIGNTIKNSIDESISYNTYNKRDVLMVKRSNYKGNKISDITDNSKNLNISKELAAELKYNSSLEAQKEKDIFNSDWDSQFMSNNNGSVFKRSNYRGNTIKQNEDNSYTWNKRDESSVVEKRSNYRGNTIKQNEDNSYTWNKRSNYDNNFITQNEDNSRQWNKRDETAVVEKRSNYRGNTIKQNEDNSYTWNKRSNYINNRIKQNEDNSRTWNNGRWKREEDSNQTSDVIKRSNYDGNRIQQNEDNSRQWNKRDGRYF